MYEIDTTTSADIRILIKAIITAKSKPFDDSKELNIAKGIVCVIPKIFPAKIKVAPNSPTDRDQVNNIPINIECLRFGSTTKSMLRNEEAPKSLADSEYAGCILIRPNCNVRI